MTDAADRKCPKCGIRWGDCYCPTLQVPRETELVPDHMATKPDPTPTDADRNDIQVAVRMPAGLVERLTVFARSESKRLGTTITRGAAIRMLLFRALESRGGE